MAYDTVVFTDLKNNWKNLLPFTFMRPVAELRVGITTLKEKWLHYFDIDYGYITKNYLQNKYKQPASFKNALLVNSAVIPNDALSNAISRLQPGQSLWQNELFIAYASKDERPSFEQIKKQPQQYTDNIIHIAYPWDIFRLNGEIIKADFATITAGRKSKPVGKTSKVVQSEKIFIEDGAAINFSVLNPTDGPIFIGKNSQIMEGSVLRGPIALCENTTIKMASKIYGGTTVGPYCKVGGEVNNVVFQAFSNKGHDGFLGNAVIGQWCNIGADTNASNLKNNYGKIMVWNYLQEKSIETGLQFCGLLMGDHSKCGINTMFNTGTVTGVSANIFGAGFPKTLIPSFTWGGTAFNRTFVLNKAVETANAMMQRRGQRLEEDEKEILTHIFNYTSKFRKTP